MSNGALDRTILKKLRARFRRYANIEFRLSQEFTNLESKAKAWGRYGAFLEAANQVNDLMEKTK